MTALSLSASSLLVFDRVHVGGSVERVLAVAEVGDEVEIITHRGRFVLPADAPVEVASAHITGAWSPWETRWDKAPAPATVARNATVRARGVAALTVGVFADDAPWMALAAEQAADDRTNVRRRTERSRDGGAAGAARWWSEAGEDALANVGILG
jgi:hypothetical protein